MKDTVVTESITPPKPKTTALGRMGRTLMLWTALVGSGFGLGRYTYEPPPLSPPVVTRVIDGDTFVLRDESAVLVKEMEVRLFGIDAPEHGQPYFEESKAELETLVLGKTLGKELILTGKGSSFNRKVCEVEVNHKPVNARMVEDGMAFSELKYGKDHFRKEEDQAAAHKKGVWQQKNGGTRPWNFRKKDHETSWLFQPLSRLWG
jgi:endonuclease YncB( thermonuclease family)